MKRTSLVVLTLVLGLSVNAHAQATGLMEVRNKVLTESREIKALLPATKDVILVSSMVDSCILTTSQLDAYFSMVGIFNTIKDKELAEDPVIYLTKWLEEMKKTNRLNIESLDSIAYKVEPTTKVHIGKLKDYFSHLNNLINGELVRVSALQRSLKIKRQK